MGGEPMAKKKKSRMTGKRLVITLMAAYVVFHLVYGGGSILNLKMQQQQLAQDLAAAYTEQASLQASLEYMNSEDAIEEIAREQLGLVKDGEILIQYAEGTQGQ